MTLGIPQKSRTRAGLNITKTPSGPISNLLVLRNKNRRFRGSIKDGNGVFFIGSEGVGGCPPDSGCEK
jgi:hypothetical protein